VKLKITVTYTQPSGEVITDTVTTNLGTITAWETEHGTSAKTLIANEQLKDFGWLFWYKLTRLGKENRSWKEFEDGLEELVGVEHIAVNPTEAAASAAS
jgi:hypothetical protein